MPSHGAVDCPKVRRPESPNRRPAVYGTEADYLEDRHELDTPEPPPNPGQFRGGREAAFRIQNLEPTAGFEPATRYLEIREQLNSAQNSLGSTANRPQLMALAR